MASRKEYDMLFNLTAQMGGGFSGTFTKAQAEFSRLGKEIQALHKLQNDVSSYQKQQNAVEATRSKLENLRKQHDLLQTQIDETTGSTAELEREKLKLEQRIKDTEAALDRQSEKLDKTSQRLEEAGVDTSNLSQEDARLTERLKELQAEQDRAAEGAEDFGEKSAQAFEAVQQAIVAAGVATALKEIGAAYMECVTIAGDFQAAMSNVEALSGATGSELEALSEKAKEMGATTKYTAKDSADAFGYMALAGWKSEQMLSGIEPVLNLAAASAMDLGQASDIVTDYLTAFGLGAQDAALFVDQMAYAQANSNTTTIALGEAYKNVAATAHSLGYSVEDTTATLMAMANAGVKGGEAGSGLSTIMTRLATNTKNCADELGEYGVRVYDSSGNMRNLSDILWDAAGAFDGLSDSEQANLAKAIAGTNQFSKLQTILAGMSEEAKAGGTSITDYADALANCSGTAGRMANTMLDNMNGKLTIMESSYDALKTSIGEQFIPVMEGVYDIGADVFSVLNDFVKANPALVRAIAAFVGVVGTATAAMTAYAAISKVVKALNMASLFTNPIFLGVTAVAALTAGVVALATAADEGIVSVKELTGAAQDMNEAIEDANTAYDDATTATLAAANVADTYIDKLEALEATGLSTDEQQKEYQNTLALLLQVMPELSDCISVTTDEYGRSTYTLNATTEALHANTEAWKKNAMAQAYQEQLTSLYQTYSSVLVEAEKNSIGLTKAQYDLETANQNYNNAIDRMNTLWAEATEAAEAFNKENYTCVDATGFLSQEYYDLQNSLYDLSDEIYVAEQNVKNHKKAIDEDAEAVAAAEEEIALAEEAVKNLTGAEEEMSDAERQAAQEAEALNGAIGDTMEQVQALTEAYNDAYDAALKSVEGQYDLWDKADKVVATSAGSINTALESQVNYWNNYNQNLASLGDRAADIEGLNEVIASFADGSADSVNAIAGMASASDEDLKKMVENYQALQTAQGETSQSIADMKTDFANQMDQLQKEFAEDIEGLDFNYEAVQAAQSTIQGYIDTANDMLPQVEAAYRKLGNAAYSAMMVDMVYVPTSGTYVRKTGYASGTENATPGWHLVGENGPELAYFQGGERVLNARQTSAVLDSGGGGTTSIQLSPSYNITGSANADELAAVLRAHDEGLRDLILETVADAQADSARRTRT